MQTENNNNEPKDNFSLFFNRHKLWPVTHCSITKIQKKLIIKINFISLFTMHEKSWQYKTFY